MWCRRSTMRASLRRTAADGLRSNFATANLLAGVYVGRILKGKELGDRPVMLSAKFEFVINLKTAGRPASLSNSSNASNGEVSGAETQNRCLQCEPISNPIFPIP